jgi:2'-5' RNA ligase
MPVAISIRAANDTARHIYALWDQASRFEDTPTMRALAYPPHITLAVYDSRPAGLEQAALAATFAGVAALRLAFGRIGFFENVPLVLWAAPAPCAALDQVHARLHEVVDPGLCRPHYRPGAWIPHCTLATLVGEGQHDRAIEFTRRAIVPFQVVFDTADLVAFPPVAVLEEIALKPPPP